MKFTHLEPKRPNTIGGVLGDIDSQLPAGHPYKDRDKVTWAHEGTHGVNARARNSLGIANGYYLLKNRVYPLAAAGVTLRELARAVPSSIRGRLYQLYLVDQQRWWNDNAFYVLDEVTAYTNGAFAGGELGMSYRFTESLENAWEMLGYAKLLPELCEQKGFGEMDRLGYLLRRFDRVLTVMESQKSRIERG